MGVVPTAKYAFDSIYDTNYNTAVIFILKANSLKNLLYIHVQNTVKFLICLEIKKHPDTQTRIHTITALISVYHQLNNKRRWNTIIMYNTQSKVKNSNQSFALKPISKANISKS